MAERHGWRDHYPPHPCSGVFPMMDDDELNTLAEDIKAHGLRESVKLWMDHQSKIRMVLDGRNRLEAMERIGLDIDSSPASPMFQTVPPDINPAAYVISRNIHRRHLTKEQRAELIVKVVQAQHENDSAKLARSFSPIAGRRGGSTKDPVLEQATKVAQHLGISPRTMERALAKLLGKPTSRRRPAGAQPKPLSTAPPPAVAGTRLTMQTPVSPTPAENLLAYAAAFTADIECMINEMLDPGHAGDAIEALKEIQCLVNHAFDNLLIELQDSFDAARQSGRA